MLTKLITKLRTLGLNISLCNWILDFLTGRPQGWVLSPLLCSLFTHDCVAKHDSNTIIKFADDTTVAGRITDDDETAYREEVRDLTVWCQDNNLSLNVTKTKEMIVDYRNKRAEHALIHIDRAKHTKKVYSCTIESIQTGCITTWFGNCSASDHKALQRVVHMAQ